MPTGAGPEPAEKKPPPAVPAVVRPAGQQLDARPTASTRSDRDFSATPMRAGRTTGFSEDKRLFLLDLNANPPRWEEAAQRLNGFRDEDIVVLLEMIGARKNGVEQLAQLSAAAESAQPPKQGNAERITAFIRPVLKNLGHARQVYADYRVAKEQLDYLRMALLLNDMTSADILSRLRSADLTLPQLHELEKTVNTNLAAWPGPLHAHVVQVLGERTPAPELPTPGVDLARIPGKPVVAPPADQLAERDAKAREFGAADYADYVTNMLTGGEAFGVRITPANPVHPLFLRRLEAATAVAAELLGGTNFGVKAISGYDNRPGYHAYGLAVDIDVSPNPYIINESGEKDLDLALEKVYDRISTTLLHRPTVITAALAGRETGLATATYDQLADENDAMIAYFSVLTKSGDKAVVPPVLRAHALTFPQAMLNGLDQAQVRADYELMLTKKGGFKNRAGQVMPKADGPFVNGGPGKPRDPARGFLSHHEYVVAALRGVGLAWGATDFSAGSGDVMHFDDRSDVHHKEYVAFGAQHPA
jgi:hypothetical protein